MALATLLSFQKGDPQIAVSSTGDPSSFAHQTARTRWPKILNNIIDEIDGNLVPSNHLNDKEVAAAQKIKTQVTDLKTALASNAILPPLPTSLGHLDIEIYNAELASFSQPPTWQNAPWLFTECYLYRLLHTFFTTSSEELWQRFDPFKKDKVKALVGSRKGTIELVKHFLSIISSLEAEATAAVDEEKQKALLEEMLQISLWGNATDLSLLTSMTVEELDSRQGKAAREKSRQNVVDDDTEEVWTLLSGLKKEGKSGGIHIVLDNAGFELLADLVLASYLIKSGFTKKVTLHGKRMPWFVSDVNPSDFTDLVNGFAHGTMFEGIDSVDYEEVKQAGKHWQGLIQQSKLGFSAHPFWTTQHSYGRMAVVEPKLYERLAEADLVIYKGDLNYRKLVYDGYWPKTTTFEEAIGPLARKSEDGKGVRTLALRTAKADVGVGLKPGVEETLPDDWTRTGKYAMVSYWDGKA
ncbi:uncharacterized protein KY384_008639 [Bacidia gigantensis]|uniref:uncharacterized protein n=1 Tax=Bacidia gigantensis TaxID=2732470 RepID=UPI001D038F0E|nr:uncharacterized protein KY384_008639 [Bacidia gigantensis]KAG8527209.1 hypothetical protein KY384_008639 [Bacidia gigantensis]